MIFLSKMTWEAASEARYVFALNQILIFFVLGICFALIVYNGYILYRNPRWDILYLAGYILVTALFIANIHGVATIYFFPSITAFELQLGLVLVHISSILIGLYVRSYFKPKKLDIQNLLLIGMICFMALSLILCLAYQKSVWYQQRRIVEGVVIISTLAVALYRKQQGATFLIAAFTFALAGRYISEYMAVIKFGSFIGGDVPYLIGFLLQMILFTTGSSKQMISTQQNLQKAKLEKQQILENQNQQLNSEVEKRTKELKIANTEITERNRALEQTIAHLKDTQKQLIANEKMASIGKLTAGLAHELNNPLNFIGGSIDPSQKRFT